MDNLKIKVFLYAVDTGSLAKAAAALGYTPSGVSHMMASLREEVGFPLLIRLKNGVIPTNDAKKLIPLMREQVTVNERLEQMAAEIRGLTQGTLKIGAYSSIAAHWLPKVLSSFCRDYPNIRVEMLEGVWQEIETYLKERRVDIGFYSWQPSIQHEWISLRKDRMVVAVPPDHPFAEKESIRLADLKQEHVIMPAFGADIDVVNLLRKNDIELDYAYSTLQNYSAMSMVEEGMGVLVMNELITKGRNNRFHLIPIEPESKIDLGMAVPYESQWSPVIRTFIEYVKRIIKEEE